MDSELSQACDRLLTEAGGRKVLVCDHEGEILAHAGDYGLFADEAQDALAAPVADALTAAMGAPSPRTGTELGASFALGKDAGDGLLRACITVLGTRGVLVVVYDQRTSLERVRIKMRRAREVVTRHLPSENGPADSTPVAS